MRSYALDNDIEFAFNVAVRNTAGQRVPATGLAGLTVWWSDTDAGTAIVGTSVDLTERALAPGQYAGILDGADARAAMGASRATAYRVVSMAGNVLISDQVRIDQIRRMDG